MTDLKGKTLFITGATRGIGYAIAEKAARDGANIAIIAKTTEPHPKLPGTIHTAAEDLIKAGGNAIGIKTDIRFEDQVLAAVDKTVETFGGIDICINNASAISLTPTLNTDMKKYDLMHNINTRGTFILHQIGRRLFAQLLLLPLIFSFKKVYYELILLNKYDEILYLFLTGDMND